MTFGNFQQGFTNFLCLTWSAVISVTQLSQSYHPEFDTSKVMKQNITMSFPAIQMHNSDMTVVRLKELPSKLVSHAYLIFRNKWDIFVLHLWWLLVTSSRVSPIFSVWPDQRSSVYLNYHSYVILKSIYQKLWSKTFLWASQPYKCTILKWQLSGSKSYPQSWCHMPTLFSEISEISHILHLWWLLVTSSRVSPTSLPDQRSSV